MTRLVAKAALFGLLMAPLACNQEPAPTAGAGAAAAPAAASAPAAAAPDDPAADIATESDYEEQADLAVDKNNYVDRLDELEKEIDAPDPR
ncbi:MAG: hypothetical protein JW940_38545 [Polyangiaceae bacterium]|nr:hypothetical protein [Polyangiaceae bacterium]